MNLADKIRQACMLMVERKDFQMTLHRDEWMQIYDALQAPRPEELRIAHLERALHEISLGKGAFSLDPLEHAKNAIENMKGIALNALGPQSEKP